MTTPDSLPTIPHVIGGEHSTDSERFAPVHNPATGRQTAQVPLASADLVHEAARIARAAQHLSLIHI